MSSSVGILIDLDAILDTRLGNIKLQQPLVYEEIKESPKYYLRKEDLWGSVHSSLDHQLLTLSYQGRDLETIKASQITAVIRNIIDTVGGIKAEILAGNPEVTDFFFVLNIHPYQLDEDIITEIARFAVTQLGYPDVPIGYIDLPFEKISLKYLRENNILHWYCYHYHDWLLSQYGNVKEGEENTKIEGFVECKMYCPKLSSDQKKIDDLMDSLLETVDVDQFAMTKIAFSSVININFLPTSVFSRLDVEKLIKVEKGEEVERSNIINVFYQAVEELKLRLGEQPVVDFEKVNQRIEELGPRLIELQALNQRPTASLFRLKLAEFLIEAASLYNATPFSPGDDLEQTLDFMSLMVDTDVVEYIETEKHWNEKGIRTIRQEYRLPGGELIYRCINADTGELLTPAKKNRLQLKAVDDLVLNNYFRKEGFNE